MKIGNEGRTQIKDVKVGHERRRRKIGHDDRP